MYSNRNLPKLDYLLAFDAVAEYESIAKAARAFNISESSVSRKIRLLEEHFEQELFIRNGRSILITNVGQELLNQIRPALQDLRTICNAFKDGAPQKTVLIAATNSVSSLWLLPKIRQLRTLSPNTNIKLLSSDDDQECLNRNNDLVILRGEGYWPGWEATQLFGETIFPVCSPDYLSGSRATNNIEELGVLSLIDVSSKHTEWMRWKTWLERKLGHNYNIDNVTIFNTYPLAIQAAIDGLGIALGWGHLVDRYLDTGELIRPFGDHAVRTQSGYFLLSERSREPSKDRKMVEDFILHSSQLRKKYSFDKNDVLVINT